MNAFKTHLAGFALLLLMVSPLHAANNITQLKEFDADDTENIFCSSLGKLSTNSGVRSRSGDIQSERKVKTTGSSVNVTSDTASSGALRSVSEGDIFAVVLNGKREERLIVTVTDENNIVLDEAIDLSAGYFYLWREVSCDDVDSAAGAIRVDDLASFQISIEVDQMTVDSGGINLYIECRHEYDDFDIVEEKNVVSADGIDSYLTRVFDDFENFLECRGGFSVPDDDATDTDADAESISIYFRSRVPVN